MTKEGKKILKRLRKIAAEIVAKELEAKKVRK